MEIVRVKLVNSHDESLGCEKAPIEVLKELRKIKSKESGELVNFDKLRLEEIHVNLQDVKESNYLIFENSKEIFEKNFKSFFIGGDHNVSYSIVRAFGKVEKNPLLIVFDAYANCFKPEEEPTNKQWLRKLVESGFDSGKIVLVSARNFSEDEIIFLKSKNITLIKMDVLQEDIAGVCDIVMERARDSSGFYVSIDVSCVDPAYAPGTFSLEPGGLSSRDLIYFIKRLRLLENFKGADIVEINPDLDVREMTVKLGAKLLSEMI